MGALAGCQRQNAPQQKQSTNTIVPDQSHERATFRYSTQLISEYHDDFKVVRFSAANRQADETWLLLARGRSVPSGYRGAKVIPIPVKRLAVGTYRYGGLLEALGLADTLVAYANTRLVTAPSIRARIASGQISRNFTPELVAGLEADVLLNYYSNSDLLTWDNVDRRLGIASLPMAEHLEPDALARTEWIKLIGMLFNRERAANSLFLEIETRYNQTLASLPPLRKRPRVAVQIPSGDFWYVYGSRNLLAQFITTAGGDYLWPEEDSARSMHRVPFEVGYDRALRADAWIIGADFAGRADLERWVAGHKYLSRLPAYRHRRAFAAAPSNIAQGNPYWDYALIEPQEELLDHVSMLQPEILPERTLRFYRQL
jgi:iron complex transport system substrate-binding protein